MNVSDFFAQVEADMTERLNTTPDVVQAYDLAMTSSGSRIAAGRWRWAGDTLVRICDVSYSWAQKWHTDITLEQLADINSEQIHHLWHSAARHLQLPKHIIVMIGCTEMHEDSEAVPVWAAHHRELSKLRSSGQIDNFCIIVSVNHSVHTVNHFRQQPDTVVVPWFLYNYYHLYTHPVTGTRGDRILFTPGKVAWHNGRRMDRVVTLCYLLNTQTHSRWLWSYTGTKYDSVPNKELSKLIRQVITQHVPANTRIPTRNPLVLLDSLARSLDQNTQAVWQDHGHHHITHTIPRSVYQQVCAEWVCETWFDQPTHLTEKLFRPILTGTPWVTANPAHTEHLEATTDFVGYCSELATAPPAPRVTNVNLEQIPYHCALDSIEELRSTAHTKNIQHITEHNLAVAKHTTRSTTAHILKQLPGTNTHTLSQLTLSPGVAPPKN